MRILKYSKYILAISIVCLICLYSLFNVHAIQSSYTGFYDNLAGGAPTSSGITIGSTAADSSMHIVYDRNLDSYPGHKSYIIADELTAVYISVEGESEVTLQFVEYQPCTGTGSYVGMPYYTDVDEIWNGTFEINTSTFLFFTTINWYEIHEAGNIYHKDA